MKIDSAKINVAVLAIQQALAGLSETEREIVTFTVQREASKPGRKRGSRKSAEQGTLLCDDCAADRHPNTLHGACPCVCNEEKP